MDTINNSSHIFYIIFIMLCSILIINVIERNLVEDLISKKKNINPIFYEKILQNLKIGKIVLYIGLFTIFVILINPIKLLSIMNPNIFSIYGDQYSYIINYINNVKFCDTPNLKYLKTKPPEILYLDKSINEFVLNTSDEYVLDRILSDFNYDKEKLCNLTKSIELENALKKITVKKFEEEYINILNKIQEDKKKNSKLKGGATGEEAAGEEATGKEAAIEEAEVAQVEEATGEEAEVAQVEEATGEEAEVAQVEEEELKKALEKERENEIKKLEEDLEVKPCNKQDSSEDLSKNEEELLKRIVVEPNSDPAGEVVLLDDSQYGKFSSFNKVIKNVALNKVTNYNYNPKYHIVLILFSNYLCELAFDLVQFLETRPKNNDIEIIIPNGSEPITISTIIYNIIILVCILQLLNNKVWLADSQLINSDTNRFIPILLFVINTVSKFIFKSNKYVTYDNFLTLKIISILCNLTNLAIIINSLISSNNDKNDAGYPDFIQCNYFYKYIFEEISDGFGLKTLNTLYLYPSLVQMIPLSYIIHSLNDKYYIKNRDSKHYHIGIIGFVIAEFIILTVIYPKFRYINTETTKFFEFKNLEFLQLFKTLWIRINETNKDAQDAGKFQVINITGNNIYSIGFNIFLTSVLLSILIYPFYYIANNGWNKIYWALICAHIFFCLIFVPFSEAFTKDIQFDNLMATAYNYITPLSCASIWALCLILAFELEGKEETEKFYKKMFTSYLLEMSLFTIGLTLIQFCIITFYKENLNMIILHTIIIILTIILYIHFSNKKNNDMQQLTVAGSILILLICELFVNKHSWDKDRYKIQIIADRKPPNATQAGGELINNQKNELSDVIIKIVIIGSMAYIAYKIYKNYTDKKNKKNIKGGNVKREDLDSLGVEVSPTDIIDKEILQLGVFIVILLILYGNNLLNTNDLKSFIDESLLNPTNLNVLRLMFFPFIIIAIIVIIGGQKFFRSILLRQMEEQSIGNLTVKSSIKKKYSDSINNKDVMDKTGFRVFKYVSFVLIILWYIHLIYNTRISLSSTLVINLIIIGVYIFLIQQVIYIFYKIYMNENINKITEEVDKLLEIKNAVKFKKGKINPKAIEEIIEIDTDKLKIEYEQFINEIYTNIYDMLSINNIFITSAIEFYIKTKLIKHKKLEDEFHLSVTNQENNIKEEAINKLDINGKWTNEKDDNNILIYVYGSVAIVLYLNKTSYQNMKMPNIVNKGTMYEFIENNELLFTYVNEKIVIDNVNYTKLSNEFSTDNIIKKTLSENDVFKNLNYMISIDKDSKYIGKYNLVEDLTKYNLYKNNGDPLKSKIEEIILNKVLLIKAIRDGKYKEANIYSKKLNVLETKFRKKQRFNRFDTNRDGVIDSNEIENYVNKNHKLSTPGNVKIKSAIFDGTHIIITFDKTITNNPTSAGAGITLKNDSTFANNVTPNEIIPNNVFKLYINNKTTSETDPWNNGGNAITNATMIDGKTLKLKINTTSTPPSPSTLDNINSNNNIEIRIETPLYINSDAVSTVVPSKPEIKLTLKKTQVKVIKTINNFEEFDASIFGT